MTVTSETSSVSYTGNGSNTVFAVPFPFLATTELVVTVAGVLKTLNVHYTVADGQPTGSVTFGSAVANGAALLIVRTVPITQTLSLRAQGPFSAKAHEDALDELTFIAHQLVRRIAVLETSVASITTTLTALGYT